MAVALAALIGLVGVLHMPFARPLLARIAGCPVGKVTPEVTEQARQIAMRRLRGTQSAPARPALGFALDAMTLTDVSAWASSHGVTCTPSRKGTILTCLDVPDGVVTRRGGGPVSEVSFGFSVADHRLISVSTLRSAPSTTVAAQWLLETTASLRQALGDPSTRHMAGPSWDGSGPAFVSYRFNDYLADVTAMNLPERGVMVREHYVSARDITPSPAGGGPAKRVNATF